MTAAQLLEPILTGGVQNTNYFNGRLLMAEDLRADQLANRRQHEQLGGALGDGVCYGLRASLDRASTPAEPLLRIEAGLALNRKGEAIELPSAVSVALLRVEPAPQTEAGLFAVCAPPSPTLTNPGLYLLTIAPAAGFQGQAPKVEYDSAGLAGTCGSRFAVEGVRFSVIEVQVSATADGLAADIRQAAAAAETMINAGAPVATLAGDPTLSRLRNAAAHYCFGSERLATVSESLAPADPASLLERYYNSEKLTPCEVPLALIYWSRGGVGFVDNWAARRLAAPLATLEPWARGLGRKRAAEGLAALLQFQEHAAALIASGLSPFDLSVLAGLSYFRYLPAAGFLPIGRTGFPGFQTSAFFQLITVRGPEFMDDARIANLLTESFTMQPVNLQEGEFLWLYRPWQNQFAIDEGKPVAAYVMFASPHLEYQALAKFDVSRWEYSSWSECCLP